MARVISGARRGVLRNPPFWITVVASALILLVYQGYPWREWQFNEGIWRHFSWLSNLHWLVLHVELPLSIHGSLFLLPIVYGSLAASWSTGLVAWLFSLAWILPTFAAWGLTTVSINVAVLLLPALVTAVVTLQRRWRESEKRNYVEREHERQSYVARLVETQEAERQRIAQELHDDSIQTLMAIANSLASLTSSDDIRLARQEAAFLKQQVLTTIDDLRRISMNLRPSILDNFGLVPGIEWLVNASNLQNTCQFDVTLEGRERELPDLAQVTLFRVTQEAIQNVHRHANARMGTVRLQFKPDCLNLSVSDDGMGFQRPERLSMYANQGKLGIIGIHQRIVSLGGSMKLDSRPHGGTLLSVTIPDQPDRGPWVSGPRSPEVVQRNDA